jgi:hypothetical protein
LKGAKKISECYLQRGNSCSKKDKIAKGKVKKQGRVRAEQKIVKKMCAGWTTGNLVVETEQDKLLRMCADLSKRSERVRI